VCQHHKQSVKPSKNIFVILILIFIIISVILIFWTVLCNPTFERQNGYSRIDSDDNSSSFNIFKLLNLMTSLLVLSELLSDNPDPCHYV